MPALARTRAHREPPPEFGHAPEERAPLLPRDWHNEAGSDEIAGAGIGAAAGVVEAEVAVAGEHLEVAAIFETAAPVVTLEARQLGLGEEAIAELVVQEPEKAVREVVVAVGM